MLPGLAIKMSHMTGSSKAVSKTLQRSSFELSGGLMCCSCGQISCACKRTPCVVRTPKFTSNSQLTESLMTYGDLSVYHHTTLACCYITSTTMRYSDQIAADQCDRCKELLLKLVHSPAATGPADRFMNPSVYCTTPAGWGSVRPLRSRRYVKLITNLMSVCDNVDICFQLVVTVQKCGFITNSFCARALHCITALKIYGIAVCCPEQAANLAS